MNKMKLKSSFYISTILPFLATSSILAIFYYVGPYSHPEETQFLNGFLVSLGIFLGFGAVFSIFGLSQLMRKIKNMERDSLVLSSDIQKVTGASDQFYLTSQDLLKGSVEQAEGLQQTVSAMDEITAMAMKTNDASKTSNDSAVNCLNVANTGKSSISNMQNAFNIIKTGNTEFEEFMIDNTKQFNEIIEVINKISEKTQIINDIVFQTKLLSFNASVEAARAGEHGKGFAVVAEEIGNLATMSGGAAGEIGGIVETSIKTVNEIVERTRSNVSRLLSQSGDNIKNGEKTVTECTEIFNEIQKNINVVSGMVQEISTASDEQMRGIEEVSKAMLVLDQNNQRTTMVATSSEEVAKNLAVDTQELILATDSVQRSVFGEKGSEQDKITNFVWNNKLMLGVQSMDDEHKILVDKINHFVDSLNNSDESIMLEKLKDLAGYTTIHFKDEEDFMRSIGYPDLDAHKRIHENLLEHVGKYLADLENGVLDKKKIISFLKNWLVSHIMGVDMKYASFTKENQRRAA